LKTNADVWDDYDDVVGEPLGAGGYSEVWKMCKKGQEDGPFYAVKILREVSPLDDDPETVNEIGIMLSADHDNIVKLHEVYKKPGEPLAFVMDCIENEDLPPPPDLMTVMIETGPLSMQDLAKVTYQTAMGIDYLNRELGAFHRDLKPDNILIGEEGFDQIRIADFGHGRCVGAEIDSETAATMNKGTAGYSAPETISDFSVEYGMYGKEVDVWSLGVIVYMCASGIPPFPVAARLAHTARERTLKGQYKPMEGPKWTKVPNECKDLIRSMLVVDPRRRATMEDIYNNPWIRRMAGIRG
jgi:serine/threonine protein kinase